MKILCLILCFSKTANITENNKKGRLKTEAATPFNIVTD